VLGLVPVVVVLVPALPPGVVVAAPVPGVVGELTWWPCGSIATTG
jgi:hypothetical protein